MSQPVTKCHNKAQVVLSATMSFYVTTLLKKIVKKIVATVLNSIAIIIKVESKGAVSRQYFLCRNIKS